MKEEQKEKTGLISRRSLLTTGTALFLGGAAGCSLITGPTAASAPPLPWPWVKLDPLEAGRRAYRGYLKNKG